MTNGFTGSAGGTPALTPPTSYASSLSPASIASHPSSVNYPSLPALTTAGEIIQGLPPSALGGAFDLDQRRRYSVGILQGSAPTADKMDVDDNDADAQLRRESSTSTSSSADSISRGVAKVGINSPTRSANVDSALEVRPSSPETICPKRVAMDIIKKLRSDIKLMLKEIADEPQLAPKDVLMAEAADDSSNEKDIEVKKEISPAADVAYPVLSNVTSVA